MGARLTAAQAPTRELAQQTAALLRALTPHWPVARIACVHGGAASDAQRRALQQQVRTRFADEQRG